MYQNTVIQFIDFARQYINSLSHRNLPINPVHQFEAAEIAWDFAREAYERGKSDATTGINDEQYLKALTHIVRKDTVIQDFLHAGQKINAIKDLRRVTACSLLHAKQAIEGVEQYDESLAALREKLTGGQPLD